MAIFLYEGCFDEAFVPDDVPYREEQMGVLAKLGENFITEGLRGSTSVEGGYGDRMCVGPVGAGKTAVLTKFYTDLDSRLKKLPGTVPRAYIMCTSYFDSFHIVCDILTQNGQRVNVREGRTEIMARLRKLVQGRRSLFVFDEPTALLKLDREEGNRLFFTLSRLVGASIVGATNNVHWAEFLDVPTMDSFNPLDIEFPAYSEEELYGILERRARMGLARESYDDEVLSKIARYAHDEGGSARTGLVVLRHAGKRAEMARRDRITIDDVHYSTEKNKHEHTLSILIRAPHTFHAVLSIAAQLAADGREVGTAAVAQLYRKEAAKRGLEQFSHQWIFKVLGQLADMGYLESELKGRGDRQGVTRIYRFVATPPPGEILEYLRDNCRDCQKAGGSPLRPGLTGPGRE